MNLKAFTIFLSKLQLRYNLRKYDISKYYIFIAEYMQYKRTVLTSLGIIMSSINMYIVLISLPTIFRELSINPFLSGEFAYLL